MAEQFKEQSGAKPENLLDKVREEYRQIHEEMMELLSKITELETEFFAGLNSKDGLSKEEFDLNVDKRDELFAQYEDKRKTRERLEGQMRAIKDAEVVQRNNYPNDLDQE
ncbi:MAG TPA: hypothetical protein VK255_02740 [Patescibacteria group bacterium]|nr:hypothetical protein [Patescibacteria group bacterium]